MKWLCDELEKALGLICAFSLGAFAFLIILDVACRFVFHFPITWLNELSIFLFQLTSFTGAAIALRKGMHFGLGLMVKDVWPTLSKFFQPIAIVIVAITACLIVYLGIIMAKQAWNSTYTTLPFSQATIYVVTSISASIMVLFSLEELLDRLREKTGQET
jgi:TRAP-type C4-dicarboxylate transport system permease small subunit